MYLLGYGPEVLWFDFRQGTISVFKASRQALGADKPLRWIPGALTYAMKRPGREADYSRLVLRMCGVLPPLLRVPQLRAPGTSLLNIVLRVCPGFIFE